MISSCHAMGLVIVPLGGGDMVFFHLFENAIVNVLLCTGSPYKLNISWITSSSGLNLPRNFLQML